MGTQNNKDCNRRDFLKSLAVTGAGTALLAPACVPSNVVRGPDLPSNRIHIGAIGLGRISRGADMPGVLKFDQAHLVAVCDVDSKRAGEGKEWVQQYYHSKRGKKHDNIKVYGDYRRLLENQDIDAVLISTPDHWHALPAIAAARAGKDIYMQKPASLTISEGRAVSDAIHRSGVILQVGSQQRSSEPFRRACEMVRNGRIGELHTVRVGLPGDPGGEDWPEMPIPPNLNFDMWMGSTPVVPYTEKGVHPQEGYGRPGWLRIETYGAGMITGWGSHHLDTAHWGMGTEYTGPVEVEGDADFPKSGLWNVHGDFRTEGLYANGVRMICGGDSLQGVRFEGSEGHIYVKRWEIIEAEPASILETETGPNEIHLYRSEDHYGNFLDSVKSRRQPAAPIEIGHRSCSVCLLHQMAMHLPRKLTWDPVMEKFEGDDEANSMLSRPMRPPWRIG
ncbi:oxidoreductase [bacterium I07]|nr:oxidoreductase [bacterium I07]